jgi:hypothetical protein
VDSNITSKDVAALEAAVAKASDHLVTLNAALAGDEGTLVARLSAEALRLKAAQSDANAAALALTAAELEYSAATATVASRQEQIAQSPPAHPLHQSSGFAASPPLDLSAFQSALTKAKVEQLTALSEVINDADAIKATTSESLLHLRLSVSASLDEIVALQAKSALLQERSAQLANELEAKRADMEASVERQRHLASEVS